MKFGPVVAGLLAVSLCVPAVATTLKLSPEIDLLVVDGKKIAGSLLKGADSLELDNGQHQILFTVSKTVRTAARDRVLYTSSPLIAAFDTEDIKLVAIQLPRIDTERDGEKFTATPNYRLVDQNGKSIPVRQDTLKIEGVAVAANLENEVARYNASKNRASMLAFANVSRQPTVATIPVPFANGGAPVAQKSVTLQGENVAEQMLQYWFLQADKETQQRFLKWTKNNGAR